MQDSESKRYSEIHPASANLYTRARKVIAGGITHDSRRMEPFPIFVKRARGAHKWDADDRRYIDYWIGHGSLLFGHCDPQLIEVAREQLDQGTHYGACHELEVRWAELICELVPCAERVRFTMTGTEAASLAFRLARAATGKDKIIKFNGHFHGWHDYGMSGYLEPYEVPSSAGIPSVVAQSVLQVPFNNLDQVERALKANSDVAAVILEPTGSQWGTVPVAAGFLEGLRELANQFEVVLIFDEVVTGFRYGPGGAQSHTGVTPDLCILGKIVAGGLPGAAVAGHSRVIDYLAHRDDDASWNRNQRVLQQGTYNANPLSAVAGIAMLERLRDGTAQREANGKAKQLRQALTETAQQVGVNAWVYGETSWFHVCLGAAADAGTPSDAALRDFARSPQASRFRRAMLNRGMDLPGSGGWVSTAHSMKDIEQTAEAFAGILKEEQPTAQTVAG